MKNESLFLFKLSSVLCILVLVGCKKYEDMHLAKSGWNPNLAIPIGHANFGVYDVLASIDSNDLVIIDPATGEVALVYSSEIASFDAQSVVQFGTIAQSQSFSLLDFNIPVSGSYGGNANALKSQDIQVNMASGIEIDSVLFKSGSLDVHFETELKHDLSITMTFPGLIKNGAVLTRTVTQIYSGTIPQVQDIQIDLAGVYGDFTLNGTTFNQTEAQVQVSVMGTGNEILGTETCAVNFSLNNGLYEHVMGYFGQQNVGQVADSVLLRIFQNASQGTFKLRDPRVNFVIDNSFGFPVDISLANLKTINVSTGVQTPLISYPNLISVLYPTQLGQTSTTTLELNNSNTNDLSTIISPTPKFFYYETNAISNPANDASINNFIEDDSRFILRAEVDMPLDGWAQGFNISDTVAFDFTQDTKLIESVMFRIIVDNGFPVRLGTQIDALDKDNNVIFSLFPAASDIVEAALVDANGVVNQRTNKITDILLLRTQIDQLPNVKRLRIYGDASTTDVLNGTMVKFFDYYNINVKLAMQIQGNGSF